MDNNTKVLEVEGGFIRKQYDSAGSVVAQSAVCATEEEAEEAELVSVNGEKPEPSAADAPAIADAPAADAPVDPEAPAADAPQPPADGGADQG